MVLIGWISKSMPKLSVSLLHVTAVGGRCRFRMSTRTLLQGRRRPWHIDNAPSYLLHTSLIRTHAVQAQPRRARVVLKVAARDVVRLIEVRGWAVFREVGWR